MQSSLASPTVVFLILQLDGPSTSRALDEDTVSADTELPEVSPNVKWFGCVCSLKNYILVTTHLIAGCNVVKGHQWHLSKVCVPVKVPHSPSIHSLLKSWIDVIPLLLHQQCGHSFPGYNRNIAQDGTGNHNVTCPVRTYPEAFQALESVRVKAGRDLLAWKVALQEKWNVWDNILTLDFSWPKVISICALALVWALLKALSASVCASG